MIVGNNLRILTGLTVFLMLCPQVELLANRKGDKFLKLARVAEARKDWELALDYYTKAMDLDPTDPAYEVGVRRMRFQAGQLHVNKGQQLRESGQVEASLLEFQRAFAIDPSSAIALQEMKRTMEMIERFISWRESFSPNIAKSGWHCRNNFVTMVATPVKKCGRKSLSKPAAGPSTTMRVEEPSGYMSCTCGA